MTDINLPKKYSDIAFDNYDLRRITERLTKKLAKDGLVQQITFSLRTSLKVDRVLLYFFYRKWKGQVTFESLSDRKFSIIGMTGGDDCFNQEYAQMYLEGRIKATNDINLEPITECHREFLQNIQVRSNLVVPVLTNQGLWGLLVAHHCQNVREWLTSDVELMQEAAQTLTTSPSIV